MISLGRFLKIIVMLTTVFVSTLLMILLGGYLYFAQDLPHIQKVSDYHPQLVSTVYGSDGTKIGEFWSDERRELVAVDSLQPLLIQAFLAAEDARFFEHRGIDFRGTLRAFLANFKAGGVVQGGSTITQQVTRSLLLSRQRSYTRKIKEAILATRLERYLNKDQILFLYLNQIYFGNRAYGVKAAAENYFHKDIKDLNLAEITLLAGLPRAPQIYSPLENEQNARERQRYVLSRLLELQIITPQEMEKALQTQVTLYRKGTDKESNLEVAPYFMEYLRQVLLNKYGARELYYGGLKIYTTLDPSLQKAAQKALRRGVEVVDRRRIAWQGPLGHVDPTQIETEKEKLHEEILRAQSMEKTLFPSTSISKTSTEEGKIYKAIVTGFEGNTTTITVGNIEGKIPFPDVHFDEEKLSYFENVYLANPPSRLKIGDVVQIRAEGENQFSFYQIPKIQGALYSQETKTGYLKAMVGGYDFSQSEFNRAMIALRQPGSAFKPFVYAAALDKGYTLRTPVADTPFVIPVGDKIWAPKNYDGKYRGITTVHQAIVHSYNVATARVAFHIRLDYLTGYLRKMGITTPVFKYPSMSLGANEIHLNEIVTAYATFPNLGILRPTVFITKIVGSKGKILEEYMPPPEPNVEKTEETTEGLNPLLYAANKKIIEQDNLKLFPSELKVLYGDNIPQGYVMTPQTAYLMVQMMSDVVNMGTATRVKKLGRPTAGKTGTSNDVMDTWFIGYIPELAAGVWVGFDTLKTLGKGEQGGRTAAPIFLDYMQEAALKYEKKTFEMPKELEGKELFALSGGSAYLAEYIPIPSFGLIEGGSSVDRAADFLEADLEGSAPSTTSETFNSQNNEMEEEFPDGGY